MAAITGVAAASLIAATKGFDMASGLGAPAFDRLMKLVP
jgi:hypothetical protein